MRRNYKQLVSTTSSFIQHLLSVYQDLTVPMVDIQHMVLTTLKWAMAEKGWYSTTKQST